MWWSKRSLAFRLRGRIRWCGRFRKKIGKLANWELISFKGSWALGFLPSGKLWLCILFSKGRWKNEMKANCPFKGFQTSLTGRRFHSLTRKKWVVVVTCDVILPENTLVSSSSALCISRPRFPLKQLEMGWTTNLCYIGSPSTVMYLAFTVPLPMANLPLSLVSTIILPVLPYKNVRMLSFGKFEETTLQK